LADTDIHPPVRDRKTDAPTPRPGQRLLAWLWRLGLRLRFDLFQRHRHDREVLEEIVD
jgi:hypothetical protein